MKQEISPEELRRDKKKYKIIDVREEWEFKEGHIAGAKNIPFSVVEWEERAGKISRIKPLVVYCMHGIRSDRVVKFLQAKGYKNVRHLAGGFEAWLR